VYDRGVTERAARPTRHGRSESREVTELRALKERQPDLSDVIDMHLELLEVQRRVQGRMPLPSFDLTAESFARHQLEARPLLRFEDIPIDPSDLRLVFRQTAEILRRHDALEAEDFQRVQAAGRDAALLSTLADWYRASATRHVNAPVGSASVELERPVSTSFDHIATLALRPFLSRCAEVVQQRAELNDWQQPYCAMCGGEPDFAVITPAAERHLICSRCGLRWKFDPLACPFCRNSDRSRITSFATPDGQYRLYACDVCSRYLKAYDARRAARPVMPVVDMVATIPLDAAAMQRGYTS
jgi:formate dehydrogenase maturation protein FdhE